MTDPTEPFLPDRPERPDSASAAGADDLEGVIGSQIGPYKLLQRIGEGGMGSVFMAEQEKPIQRRVALKIIKPGMDSKHVVARFEAERQALSMMDHANIAHVLDVGTTEKGRPYFVMELIRGVPITRYCDEKNLRVEQRLHLFGAVCNAIQHAHQKGVIHRDLKPSNILVAEYDGQPTPKIIDFGLAKALHQKLTDKTMFTQMGQVVGTLEYMSPEQSAMNQLEVDTRTDIYSLGVLLYELLTGTLPFEKQRLRAAAFDQVIRIIREEEPPKPSRRLSTIESSAEVAANRGLPPNRLGLLLRGDLDWIVMKTLEKDRDRRYESASGLESDVRRYVAGEPVWAAPPSALYRLRKFVGRNRVAVVAALFVAGAMLVAILGTSWGMVMAIRERKRVAAQASSASAALRDANAVVAATLKELRSEYGDESAPQDLVADLGEQDGLEVDALGVATKQLAISLSQSLKDQARSRALAEQSVTELELITQYQAEQLAGVDVPLMAVRMRTDLLERIRAVVELTEENEAAAKIRFGEAEQLIAGADFTGLAVETLKRNVFQKALQAIDEKLSDRPLVKARLLQTVAETVRELGMLDLAEKPQVEALEIRQRELGELNAQTLQSLYQIGRLRKSQLSFIEAEAYFRRSLDGCRQVHGDAHPDTLRALNWLGNSLNHQGRHIEAEKLLREALAGRKRLLGELNVETLESHNDLGVALKMQDRYEEAQESYLRARDGLRETLGEDHPWTLTSVQNLGRLYSEQGNHEEAEKKYREALERRRLAMGEDHPRTLMSMYWLARSLQDQDRASDAEPYYRGALAGQLRILGDEHRDTLNSIQRLATLMLVLNKDDEAIPLFERGLRIRRRLAGDHKETLAAIRVLARVLEKQRKYERAEPHYREALAIRVRTLGEDDTATLMNKVWLGHVLERQGKFGEAEKNFREALAGQLTALPENHRNTLTTMWGLGRVLVGLKKFAEAEKLLRDCYERRRKVLEPDHWHLANTQVLLGAAIGGQGRFEEAEKILLDSFEVLAPPTASLAYRPEAAERIVRFYESWHQSDPSGGHEEQARQWQTRFTNLKAQVE